MFAGQVSKALTWIFRGWCLFSQKVQRWHRLPLANKSRFFAYFRLFGVWLRNCSFSYLSWLYQLWEAKVFCDWARRLFDRQVWGGTFERAICKFLIQRWLDEGWFHANFWRLQERIPAASEVEIWKWSSLPARNLFQPWVPASRRFPSTEGGHSHPYCWCSTASSWLLARQDLAESWVLVCTGWLCRYTCLAVNFNYCMSLGSSLSSKSFANRK